MTDYNRFLVYDEEIEIVRKSGTGLRVPIESIQRARARVAAGEDPDAVASELAIEDVYLQGLIDNSPEDWPDESS